MCPEERRRRKTRKEDNKKAKKDAIFYGKVEFYQGQSRSIQKEWAEMRERRRRRDFRTPVTPFYNTSTS